MINRTILVGRLTKNPELRFTNTGVAVANFTLAVNRQFSNQQGEREADFINVVAWRKTAENTANFVGKGSLVGIDGRLQTRSYDNDEGRRVYITEVVADSVQFLEPKKGHSESFNNPGNTNVSEGNQNGAGGRNGAQNDINNANPFGGHDPFADNPPIDISDDDLPF